MIRSLIAFAALACTAMLASTAPAAPPLEPAVIHALATADAAVVPVEAVAIVAPAAIAEPGPAVVRSTVGLMAREPASASLLTVGAHRVHVDPGRVSA